MGGGERWEVKGESIGGEPLWIVPKRPHGICLGACMTANLVKQAAPGNVSTRVRFVDAQAVE